MPKHDEPISTDRSEIESLRERVRSGQIDSKDLVLIDRLLGLVLTFVELLQKKNHSISRLKRLLFGPKTDTRSTPSTPSESQGDDPSSAAGASGSTQGEGKKKRRGHGRRPASSFTGATTVECGHPKYKPHDPCPDPLCRGHLYDTSAPLVFIRLTGQPLVGATRYRQQVLRCSACQERFTAPLPEGVPAEKWDASADVSIALTHYGASFPLHRFAHLQREHGVPLPPSTLFERGAALADAAEPVAKLLLEHAAAASVLFADDTSARILEPPPLEAVDDAPKAATKGEGKKQERTGLFTSVVVARCGTHRVAVYRTGRQHAGELVGSLLVSRPEGLGPPVQMGDATSRNWSHGATVEVAKCLAHARRLFVEIDKAFPSECKYVLDAIAEIYRLDDQTRGKTDEQRLVYHKTHSTPVFDRLHAWIERQFEERLVEPNSSLGDALSYLLTHWEGLTAATRVAGAPLDNNAAERALRRVVLNRKNHLFFKTSRGASVGDRLLGLILTCELNDVSAWDYLLAVARNTQAVAEDPGAWLPWTYAAQSARRAA